MSALDMEAMAHDVQTWKERQQQQASSTPSVLLVEGYTIFNYQPLNRLFDKRYFLKASEETCRQRRLTRHYTPPDVPGYFDKVVWPHYVQSFNDIKNNPDIVFLEEEQSVVDKLKIVKTDIENCLQSL